MPSMGTSLLEMRPPLAGRKQASLPLSALYVLFFLSGFPALIYQIVWQRALFAIYGVNIESVTIVVSAFMFGLGLGSLLGGLVSERPGVPLLPLFGAIELGICCCGIFSLKLFHHVATYTAGASLLKTGTYAFLLLLVPTILMGSTLPILVTYFVSVSKNVGRSVGILYFVNTLGSAASCFCAAFFTMNHLGQSGSIALAASLNALIAAALLYFCWRAKVWLQLEYRRANTANRNASEASLRLFPFPIALFVSGLAGAISLAYEILWYRVYSFVSGGEAPAFALLLAFYLAGIAFGSLAARVFCHRLDRESLARHLRLLAAWVVLANVFAYMVVPIASRLAVVNFRLWLKGPAWFWSYGSSLPFVALATVLLGASFPLICHAAVKPTSSAGARLGFLYLSNIIGSTLGSFVIGYIVMDVWTTKQTATAVGLAGLILGTALFFASKPTARDGALAFAVGVILCAFTITSSKPLFTDIWERLQLKTDYKPGYKFEHIVENKSGVITVTTDGLVSGHGVPDGMFNTDIKHDKNGLARPYSISLWHPAPRRVLMIGLASGSWAQVVANHPQLEHMTIVEINPGYLELIAQYPAVSSLLNNPKVDIVIDDGRRWLFRNPGASFDVIVMNTIYHWRMNSTNLLSAEFLQIVRRHLNPGGIAFYNPTGSGEVQLTGATVFPYALMVGNCIAVSDAPMNVNWERWKRIMREYQIDGRPSFDLGKADDGQAFEDLTSSPATHGFYIEDAMSIRARNNGKHLVTEDNMGTEWLPPLHLHLPRLASN